MSDPGEQAVLDAVAQRRGLVNDAIEEFVPPDEPERLYEASRSLLVAGGKRLRPALLLLAAEAIADVEPLSADYRSFPALDGGDVDVLAAATSVEVIHSFTLIHDDIMDDDDIRRGVPAVHRAYDLETAILAGDTLYSKAFELMLATGADPEYSVGALDVLASTCTGICEGQALDVEFESRSDVLPDEYLEMVEHKTAVLFAAAAAIPAVLLGADDETRAALHAYGRTVGQAFQIHDDVLDLTVPSDDLGKRRGSDLVAGKQTLITLHARQQGVDVDGLLPDADVDDIPESEIDDAVGVLEDAGSIDYARTKARDLVADGKSQLSTLPDNDARALLASLADYLVERGY